MTPSLAGVIPNLASVVAMRRSQSIANEAPPPMQSPEMNATVGLGRPASASSAALTTCENDRSCLLRVAFNSVMSTAWPWPYPSTYAQAESHLPILTVPMNRADPFDERDATGWQFMNLHSGRVDLSFNLYGNDSRKVVWNERTDQPEDVSFQDPKSRKASQSHY